MVSSAPAPPDHVGGTTNLAVIVPSSAPSSADAAVTSKSSAVAAPATKSSSTAVTAENSSSNTVAKSSAASAATKAAPTSVAPTSAAPHAVSQASSPADANGPQTSFTGTTTSTITETPESTLSKPSFISVIENGKTSFTAPALVTILSTSSEANGSFVTFTHVVANPTGFSQAISSGHASFFQNLGAVAGVFLVVGVIATSIVSFGLFVMCRRRRRRRERHRRWLISVNRPRPVPDEEPQDPFQDIRTPPSPPQMRGLDQNWGIPVRISRQGSSVSHLGLYDLPGERTPVRRVEPPEIHDTDDTGIIDGNDIGLAAVSMNQSRPSLAQSSPSIYPPSLPPANDDGPFEEVRSQPQRHSDPSTPPPRPRRSHLRDPPSTAQLITPPASVSSHSPVSDFANPFGFSSPEADPPASQKPPVQVNELIGRRTLLDVRRSQDLVASKTVDQRG
ncbi:hypothetical protein DFH07DRAFT_202316 [Mycena maculata]|uniref:Transmembrane protein n=1 Tax=Mycena maculata TaxID=230809 RepID=A0AAD7P1J6_9AGAR|nr:hypothetical protein DFH07DRAFT_202316 [Mycena maculata]